MFYHHLTRDRLFYPRFLFYCAYDDLLKKLTSFSLSFTPYLFSPLRSPVASEIFSGYILYHISSIFYIPFVFSFHTLLLHLHSVPECGRKMEGCWWGVWGEKGISDSVRVVYFSSMSVIGGELYHLGSHFRNTREKERVLWTLSFSDFSSWVYLEGGFVSWHVLPFCSTSWNTLFPSPSQAVTAWQIPYATKHFFP